MHEHINFFDDRSLRTILLRAEFEVADVEADGEAYRVLAYVPA
jgi:hypothetical protein